MKSRLRVLLVVLFVVLLTALVGRGWFVARRGGTPGYLLLPLRGAYAEVAPSDFFGRFVRRRQSSLLDVLVTLKRATADPHIAGIVLHLGRLEIGWAKAQDIRTALQAFRQSGKRLVAYLEQDVSAGNIEYYLASAAGEVYLPPSGSGPLNGLLSQFFFLGGVWEKLDVEMNVEKIREYKTAGDMLVNKKMSPMHREMANSILDSINGQFVAGIAAARGLDEARVRALIDECPVEPASFATAKLSDGTKFLDELRDELVGADGKFIAVDEYEPTQLPSLGFGGPKLAVIYATGSIYTGGGTSGLSGQSVGSADLIDAFEKAAADSAVQAIVFRIDSPGGSALASDLIWRATQQARAKKPVIVSMSDVAASGGYYIAAGGNQIVAEPGTLTGSIGVVIAKPNIKGLLGKLGITTETLSRGKYARLEDATSSFDPDERAKMITAMTHVYDVFLDRVSTGRHLTHERANEIGRGRVWTGAQAKENGLIDELGGFTRAIDLAKQAAGIPLDQEVPVVFYPQSKGLIERLTQYLEARASLALPAAWQRAAATLAPLDFPDGSILTLMAEVIEIR